MAPDRLTTSFNENSLTNLFGHLDTVSSTQKSSSTDYGSDIDFSWNSSLFQGTTSKLAPYASSDYGDFDSDDERVIATLLDDVDNLTSPSAKETALQNDADQSLSRIPKAISSQQSGQTRSTLFHSFETDGNIIESGSYLHRKFYTEIKDITD
jgi:hypothetical protein